MISVSTERGGRGHWYSQAGYNSEFNFGFAFLSTHRGWMEYFNFGSPSSEKHVFFSEWVLSNDSSSASQILSSIWSSLRLMFSVAFILFYSLYSSAPESLAPPLLDPDIHVFPLCLSRQVLTGDRGEMLIW